MPKSVRLSVWFWFAAIGAGVFETILAVIQFFSGNMNASGSGIFFNVVIRLIIFAILSYIIVELRMGKNWARICLTILLGGIGTLSLVIGPITWLIEGHSLNELIETMNLYTVLFTLSRIVHLASVIVALVLMFQPDANKYYRKNVL